MPASSSSILIVEAANTANAARPRLGFTSAEWTRLFALYTAIAALHICGWSLFFYYSARYPSLLGLGFLAYMLGLRHAFDADHIAAVDDTVRLLMQKGRRPLSIGFFFSLGHSTIVLALAAVLVFAAALVRQHLPAWQGAGGLIGAGISGTFLCLIGALNLLVLIDIARLWRGAKTQRHSHAHIDDLLAQRGLLNRLFGQRLRGLIKHSWQMYPLGLLFGLGFDTASEVSLLAMTAGASAGHLPIGAVLCLPALFAAGMTVMDTTDGVLMTKAYDWAFVNPMRKLFYNLVVTGLSVAVALTIGTLELLQVSIRLLNLHGPLATFIATLDFASLGWAIAALFLLTWAASAAVWKFSALETRYALAPHTHEHEHVSGHIHSHKHFH